jgi:hypothetical protein
MFNKGRSKARERDQQRNRQREKRKEEPKGARGSVCGIKFKKIITFTKN